MAESYSKDTIDAKFETMDQKMLNLETRIDGKIDLLLSGFSHLNTRLEDVWKVLIGGFVAIGVGMILMIAQNSFQKPNQTTIVVPSNQAGLANPATISTPAKK